MRALYAELPQMACKGLCWDSCGPLPLTTVERDHIRDATGVDIPFGGSGSAPRLCPALGMFRTCGVYEVRPLICRLWGLVENMPCNFGCVPEGGRLTVAEGYGFIARAAKIDGDHELASKIRETFANPARARVATELALHLAEEGRQEYQAIKRRAVADGSALFVTPGGISRTPDHPDR